MPHGDKSDLAATAVAVAAAASMSRASETPIAASIDRLNEQIERSAQESMENANREQLFWLRREVQTAQNEFEAAARVLSAARIRLALAEANEAMRGTKNET